MSKRMTWDEIRDAYPEMWVALDEVVFLNNDRINVESAVIVAVMSDDEYADKRLEYELEGKKYFYMRTEDSDLFCGVTL